MGGSIVLQLYVRRVADHRVEAAPREHLWEGGVPVERVNALPLRVIEGVLLQPDIEGRGDKGIARLHRRVE
jgi:hypothetical protein